MSQKRSEQKQRRKNEICFPFKWDISSRLINDFDFLSIESGEFRYKLNDSNGDSYDLRYEYGDLGTHTFSCVHLSRMIWDLFELDNNLEKVKKCVKDAFFASTRKRENNTFTGQIPSNLCSNQGKIPKRKEMQDGRKAEKPSRYRYIRAVGKRLHQSIPQRSCRSKFWFASGVRSFYKHPKILWFCARQCCPPQDGYQHEGRKPVYGFSHLGPMPVVRFKK